MSDAAPTITGNGPPLVLVHGVGLNRSMWTGVAAALNDCFTCIALDMPGHGDATSSPASGLGGYVDAVRECVDLYAGGRASIVGFSMGAMVAAGLAAANPDKVARLVLMNAVHRRDDTVRNAVLDRLRAAEEGGLATVAEAAISRWFSPAFIDKEPDTIAGVRQTLLANDIAAYLAAYRVFATADTEVGDKLHRIRCPVLALTAENDVNSTPAMSAAIAADVMDGRCRVLDSLAHGAPIEAPGRVAQALIEFLETEGA